MDVLTFVSGVTHNWIQTQLTQSF